MATAGSLSREGDHATPVSVLMIPFVRNGGTAEGDHDPLRRGSSEMAKKPKGIINTDVSPRNRGGKLHRHRAVETLPKFVAHNGPESGPKRPTPS
jgi:hypothetical protein